MPYDPYTKRRVDRVPSWPKTTCEGMWFGLYSDAACTHELERRQMPKGSTWLEFKILADRSETYYVKAITQPAGCWADWLARPVSGYDGGCARLAPVTNSYTVTFQGRMEGGGLVTISTSRVFWHDSATAPTPPAVDGFDAHGAWRQTKGSGGIGALTSVTEDLTYELAYMRRRTLDLRDDLLFTGVDPCQGGRFFALQDVQ